jgi:opacity protein-like surface antigen
VFVLTAAVLIVVGASPASAQWSPPDPKAEPSLDARMRLGPIFMNPTFQIKDLGIDDNVFNDVPGGERQDLTGTLSMSSLIGLQVRGFVLTVDQANSYIWYRTYTSERSVDGALKVTGELRLGALRPCARWERAETHERGGFEIDARAGREMPAWEVGSNLQVGWRLGLTGGYRFQELRYAEGEEFDGIDLKEALDHDAEEFRGYANLALTDFTSFVTGTEFRRLRFDYTPLRDSDDVYYYGGLESTAESRLGLNVKVGWKEQRHKDPTVPGFKGIQASGSTSFVVADFMRLTFSGERTMGLSYEDVYPFYLQEGGQVQSHIRFSEHFDLRGDAKLVWLRYKTTVTGEDIPRLDRSMVLGGEFGYYFGGSAGTRVGIRYEYAKRTSPVDLKNYARSRIYSDFRLSF